VQKSGNDSGTLGPSYTVSNYHLMEDIFRKFKDLPESNCNFDHLHWVLIKCDREYLSDIFKERCSWPRTSKLEKERKTKDDENKKKLKQCRRCNRYFCNKDNDTKACACHKPNAKIVIVDNTSGQVTNPNVNETIASCSPINVKKTYYWDCCGQPYLTSLGTLPGCIPCDHSEK